MTASVAQRSRVRWRYALYLFLASSAWGSLYVAGKWVLPYVPPVTLSTIRMIIAAVTLLTPVLIRRERWPALRDLPLMALLGFFGFTFAMGTIFVGVQLSTAHNGALLTATSPVFIALLAAVVLKERVGLVHILSLAIAMFGVVAIVGFPEPTAGPNPLLGDALFVANAVAWAFYSVLGKVAIRKYRPLVVTGVSSIFGILFTLPFAVWEASHYPWRPVGPDVILVVLWLGVVCTAVAFYLWNKGFEGMPAATAALFHPVQPVVGGLLSVLLLGEVLTPQFLAGGAAVIAGVVLSSLPRGVDSHKPLC
jgi:drug/metabolite transporter (DMT)-like permease